MASTASLRHAGPKEDKVTKTGPVAGMCVHSGACQPKDPLAVVAVNELPSETRQCRGKADRPPHEVRPRGAQPKAAGVSYIKLNL